MVSSAHYGRTIEQFKRAYKLFDTAARLHCDAASPYLRHAELKRLFFGTTILVEQVSEKRAIWRQDH